MRDGNDRKAYDQLVLDNMEKMDAKMENFISDQTAHNLAMVQRVSVVETKAMILGATLGTIGNQLIELLKDHLAK